MERLVKERLVGAAVLMAAAVILIPEMLSGPDRELRAPDGQSAQPRSDAPIKTYTIDLTQSPGAQAAVGVVDNRAPPPEETSAAEPAAEQPAAGVQVKPETPQASSAAAPAPTPSTPTVQPESTNPVVEAPTSDPSAPAHTPPRPLASGSDAPTSGAWAVQVGSFAKEATAERLMKQLRAQGQDAFVMPVKSGGATLYRVRIGPTKDRASADAVLRDVRVTAPGAAVVAHP